VNASTRNSQSIFWPTATTSCSNRKSQFSVRDDDLNISLLATIYRHHVTGTILFFNVDRIVFFFLFVNNHCCFAPHRQQCFKALDNYFTMFYFCISTFLISIGSSTACVLVLNRENNTVYTANIGDSGYIVVRNGEIVHKSDEQQHYFNTPFQLSLPPPGNNHVLSDSPQSADRDSFPVEDGDVILVATDGVFDNVPKNLLLDTLKQVEGERDAIKLQMTANTIAFMARSLSFDSEFMSPFAVNARKNNINTIGEALQCVC
jgi:Stage II sporulation protein E (SpoIIE)